jgi:hypothetical protein
VKVHEVTIEQVRAAYEKTGIEAASCFFYCHSRFSGDPPKGCALGVLGVAGGADPSVAQSDQDFAKAAGIEDEQVNLQAFEFGFDDGFCKGICHRSQVPAYVRGYEIGKVLKGEQK